MGRPTNKTELLDLSKSNYEKLIDLIHGLDSQEQSKEFPPGTMNRKISDVIMHLHHWHLLMMDWYKVGMAGQKPEMPAKGYTWKTSPELNRWIWEKYENTNLVDAIKSFKSSYEQIRKIIQSHSNEELYEKKRYKWTGSTSLGSYLVSCTSSHYDWAFKLIKKAKK